MEVVTGIKDTPESWRGVPAHIRPWEPHPLCRQCLRYTRIGTSVIQPAMKRKAGTFSCENRRTV